MSKSEALVSIGSQLRFLLFGLEIALGISLSGTECEQVFRDSAADQVSAKRYVFHDSGLARVVGRVDEYEPKTIWILVQAKGLTGEHLHAIAASAELHAARLTEEP